VAQTPFDHMPRGLFKARQLLLCAAIFLVLFLTIGVITGNPVFINDLGGGAVKNVSFSVLEMSLRFYFRLVYTLYNIPQECYSNLKGRHFKLCEEFWFLLSVRVGMALIPFFVSALIYQFATFNMKRIYRRARQRAKNGTADAAGKIVLDKSQVTHPEANRRDFFCWYFAMQTATIELPDKKRISVYISADLPDEDLKPGITLVAYDIGYIFGKKRWIAVVYAPHVAVIRGT